MKLKLQVLGARVLKFVREENFGDENGDEWCPVVNEEYQVILLAPHPRRGFESYWVLDMATGRGPVGHGEVGGTWGIISMRKSFMRGPVTHRPKKEMWVELDPEKLDDDHSEEAFEWSVDAGSSHEPDGFVNFNEDLFTKTGRGYNKPVVWIFKGPSRLGKSTLGEAFYPRLHVYETDQAKTLKPGLIYAQVVVLGRRFTSADIHAFFKKSGFDVELVEVNFSPLTL